MALDLKLPKLTAVEEASTETKTKTVSYNEPGYDYKALTDAEKEERIQISRKLLPPHSVFMPEPENLRFKPPVEFFDVGRPVRPVPVAFDKFFKPMGKVVNAAFLGKIDKYPDNYDPFVHGPYVPYRYYGKVDTPFLDTKIGNLADWIGRRNKGLTNTFSLVHRGLLRYQDRWLKCKNTKTAGPIHVFLGLLFTFYILDRHHKVEEKHAKYH